MNAIKDLIESRISANYFDPTAPVSDQQVAELARLATLAPSAFNVQNWQFIAVRSLEAREKLRELSFGQPQLRVEFRRGLRRDCSLKLHLGGRRIVLLQINARQ